MLSSTQNLNQTVKTPSSVCETAVEAMKTRKLLGESGRLASVNVVFNKTQDKADSDIDWQFSVFGLFDIREYL